MVLNRLSEDELDMLVSIAISRAELLDDVRSSAASDAWREVLLYETQLAVITPAELITGGVARVGAVRAALAAGERAQAIRLKAQYLGESLLSSERRAAIERAFQEDQQHLAEHFPALARSGRLAELQRWRDLASSRPPVFPRAA
jgi:hypothetical protein